MNGMAVGLEHVTTLQQLAVFICYQIFCLSHTSSNYKTPVLQVLSLCNSCSPRAKFKLIRTTS